MSSVIYLITYLPHVQTEYPCYYVGSKHNWDSSGTYMGSPASQEKYPYTQGMSLKDWWKQQVTTYPERFVFRVLKEYEDMDPGVLIEKEREVHEALQVESDSYFNQSYARRGFFHRSNSNETKLRKSLAAKRFWQSPAGQAKKARLIERNRRTKSQERKNWLATGGNKDRMSAKLRGRTLTKEHKEKIANAKRKPIEYNGQMYYGWQDLKDRGGMSKYMYLKEIS